MSFYQGLQAEVVPFRGHNGDQGEAYYARPARSGKFPGVVVIHHIPGWCEWTTEVVRKLAHYGYAAISPHLYFREGNPDEAPDDLGARIRAAGGVADAQIMGDVAGAMAYLRAQPNATGKIGVIGFCSGGRQTLLFACSGSKADAAVDCWGGFIHRATPDAETTPARPTPILNMVDRLHCPLFAVFGEEDQNPTVAQSEELRSSAQRAGKDVTIKVYKNAGHAFLADYRPSYREGPAAELWKDAVAFFDKHLKS